MNYNYKIKGFDNENIKSYEMNSLTKEEANAMAHCLITAFKCDTVFIIDIKTGKVLEMREVLVR